MHPFNHLSRQLRRTKSSGHISTPHRGQVIDPFVKFRQCRDEHRRRAGYRRPAIPFNSSEKIGGAETLDDHGGRTSRKGREQGQAAVGVKQGQRHADHIVACQALPLRYGETVGNIGLVAEQRGFGLTGRAGSILNAENVAAMDHRRIAATAAPDEKCRPCREIIVGFFREDYGVSQLRQMRPYLSHNVDILSRLQIAFRQKQNPGIRLL